MILLSYLVHIKALKMNSGTVQTARQTDGYTHLKAISPHGDNEISSCCDFDLKSQNKTVRGECHSVRKLTVIRTDLLIFIH